MKVIDIDLDEDTQIFINLADGSNIAVCLRANYENQVEFSSYTSNKLGYKRLQPTIHMVSANTLGFEIRREKIEVEECE
ncbi:MAG: hypothetical protein ACRC0F_04400 [Cetobacterium sp.]